jgi:hypothetical protein
LKGSRVDNYVRERFAGNIDTARETAGAEKDALARRCGLIKHFLSTDLKSLLFPPSESAASARLMVWFY